MLGLVYYLYSRYAFVLEVKEHAPICTNLKVPTAHLNTFATGYKVYWD